MFSFLIFNSFRATTQRATRSLLNCLQLLLFCWGYFVCICVFNSYIHSLTHSNIFFFYQPLLFLLFYFAYWHLIFFFFFFVLLCFVVGFLPSGSLPREHKNKKTKTKACKQVNCGQKLLRGYYSLTHSLSLSPSCLKFHLRSFV